MGLVPGLSLAVHLSWPMFGLIQGPPWWCAHFPAKMDSRVRVSGRLVGHIMDWHLLLPLGPSQILSEAALCSLSGPSVVRQLMQVVIIVPGQGRQLHGVPVLGEEIKRFSEFAQGLRGGS